MKSSYVYMRDTSDLLFNNCLVTTKVGKHLLHFLYDQLIVNQEVASFPNLCNCLFNCSNYSCMMIWLVRGFHTLTARKT